MGKSKKQAQGIADKFEEMDRKTMVELAHLHEFSIPMHENHAYLQKATEMRKQWEAQLKGNIVEKEVE